MQEIHSSLLDIYNRINQSGNENNIFTLDGQKEFKEKIRQIQIQCIRSLERLYPHNHHHLEESFKQRFKLLKKSQTLVGKNIIIGDIAIGIETIDENIPPTSLSIIEPAYVVCEFNGWVQFTEIDISKIFAKYLSLLEKFPNTQYRDQILFGREILNRSDKHLLTLSQRVNLLEFAYSGCNKHQTIQSLYNLVRSALIKPNYVFLSNDKLTSLLTPEEFLTLFIRSLNPFEGCYTFEDSQLANKLMDYSLFYKMDISCHSLICDILKYNHESFLDHTRLINHPQFPHLDVIVVYNLVKTFLSTPTYLIDPRNYPAFKSYLDALTQTSGFLDMDSSYKQKLFLLGVMKGFSITEPFMMRSFNFKKLADREWDKCIPDVCRENFDTKYVISCEENLYYLKMIITLLSHPTCLQVIGPGLLGKIIEKCHPNFKHFSRTVLGTAFDCYKQIFDLYKTNREVLSEEFERSESRLWETCVFKFAKAKSTKLPSYYKELLASKSEYFKQLFSLIGFKESQTEDVQLLDMPKSIFYKIFGYCDTGDSNLEEMSIDDLFELGYHAQLLCVDGLAIEVQAKIHEILKDPSIKNLIDLENLVQLQTNINSSGLMTSNELKITLDDLIKDLKMEIIF